MLFNMDNKSKGITWVGNICQKFEAMCSEVDDIMHQEALKRYVDKQVQTVGSNVKQFWAELMEDVLLPSPEDTMQELDLSLVHKIDVTTCDNSNMVIEKEVQTAGSSVKKFWAELMEDVLLPSPEDTMQELDFSMVQKVDVTTCDNSNMVIAEDHSQKELLHSSSLESVEVFHLDLSLEKSSENETHGNMEISINENHIKEELLQLETGCKFSMNETLHSNFVVDDSLEKSAGKSEGSIAEAISQDVVAKIDIEAAAQSLDKVNLEESCIIVDSSELGSLFGEIGRRSNKRQVFSPTYKQYATWYSNEQRSGPSDAANRSELSDLEFCDWEII